MAKSTQKPKKPKKIGRNPIKVDWQIARTLADKGFTVKEIAANFNLTIQSFIRICKRENNTTPTKYLDMQRKKAESKYDSKTLQRLLQTGCNPSTCCYILGIPTVRELDYLCRKNEKKTLEELKKEQQAKAEAMLRNIQFDKAIREKDHSHLFHLYKHVLDQNDKKEQKISITMNDETKGKLENLFSDIDNAE